ALPILRFPVLLYSINVLPLLLKANHNKDYSVVKTFKAGQLAFFFYPTHFTLTFPFFVFVPPSANIHSLSYQFSTCLPIFAIPKVRAKYCHNSMGSITI